MPSNCVEEGCNQLGNLLYNWPKDQKLAELWTAFARKTKGEHWVPAAGGRSTLCFRHFREDNFKNYLQYEMGCSQRLFLKRSVAVPTIHSNTNDGGPEETCSRSDTALRKREITKILNDYDEKINKLHSSQDNNSEIDLDSSEDSQDTTTICRKTRSLGTQTDSTIMPSVGSIKLLRSIGTQTGRQPKVCMNKEVQTSPMKRRRSSSSNCEDDNIEEDNEDNNEDNEADAENDAMSEQSEGYNPDLDSDINYDSDDDDSEEEVESPPSLMSKFEEENGTKHEEPKYLVFHNQLLLLLSICFSCFSRKVVVKCATFGSMLTATIKCKSCKDHRKWQSQPYHEGFPVGNFLLSGAILFSGLSPYKFLKALNSIFIKVIGYSTFFTHQKKFLHKVVHKTWLGQRDSQFFELKEEGLVVGGDARFDSMGHSAKYGSYTTMNLETSKILNVQLIQSNEVKNSNAMELKGLQETLEIFHTFDIKIISLVTDCHKQIAKWLREKEPDIKHYFDCWHISKNLKKQINLLGKKKSCKLILIWIKSIINHFYWSVMSTDIDNEELIEAKWMSILRHIQNLHNGHGKIYPTCSHSELTDLDERD